MNILFLTQNATAGLRAAISGAISSSMTGGALTALATPVRQSLEQLSRLSKPRIE